MEVRNGLIEWRDEGVVLSARRHGEGDLIVSLFTTAHGRYHGVVKGGAGRRSRATFEPGTDVDATWRARLSEHLGRFTCDARKGRAGYLLQDRDRLLALGVACGLVDATVPEREPMPEMFVRFSSLLDDLTAADAGDDMMLRWGMRYVRFELDLLAELGFGLDLGSCAATGAVEDLCYVSPRSGRAVSAAAGAPYRGRLLPLPAFLRPEADSPPDCGQIVDGMTLTGYFLENHLFAGDVGRLPATRARLAARYRGAQERDARDRAVLHSSRSTSSTAEDR